MNKSGRVGRSFAEHFGLFDPSLVTQRREAQPGKSLASAVSPAVFAAPECPSRSCLSTLPRTDEPVFFKPPTHNDSHRARVIAANTAPHRRPPAPVLPNVIRSSDRQRRPPNWDGKISFPSSGSAPESTPSPDIHTHTALVLRFSPLLRARARTPHNSSHVAGLHPSRPKQHSTRTPTAHGTPLHQEAQDGFAFQLYK